MAFRLTLLLNFLMNKKFLKDWSWFQNWEKMPKIKAIRKKSLKDHQKVTFWIQLNIWGNYNYFLISLWWPFLKIIIWLYIRCRFEMRLPGMKKDLRPIPAFKQNPGEKERHFFKRGNQEVTVSLMNLKSKMNRFLISIV